MLLKVKTHAPFAKNATDKGAPVLLSPKRQQQAADDADIGDVEHRPPLQVDEINYSVVAHDVEQISSGATESKAEADL